MFDSDSDEDGGGRIEGLLEVMWVTGVEVGVGRSVCEENEDQYFCSGVNVVAALATLRRGRGVTSVAIVDYRMRRLLKWFKMV